MSRSPSIWLEVERKFAGLKCYPLRIDSGRPPFISLRDLGRQRFHDIYYDSDGRLMKAGIYLRQRDAKWQMKIRRGGTYTNSQFEELSDPEVISAHVSSLTGLDQGMSKNFGLCDLASFTTWRQTWIADKEFNIVLDHTDFGHKVGEVELESEATVAAEDEARKLMLTMDNKIAQFLKRYEWAFSDEKPISKLSSYFAHKAHERT